MAGLVSRLFNTTACVRTTSSLVRHCDIATYAQNHGRCLVWLRAHFHSSSHRPALGVVEQLHDEVSIALPTGGSRSIWEVVEFRPDGTALETWKSPEILGLHPRDVHLFTTEVGGGHRAMLSTRGGAILFRTEVAKAVIYSDRAVLFPARRLADTVRIAQAVKSMLGQRSVLPFELKVLESLLSETALAFDKKSKRLRMVAETVMDDINRSFHASAAELQRFIPITRKLTEVQHDVKETLDAIADVVNYDDELQAICLTERAKAIKGGSGHGRSQSSGAGGEGLPSDAKKATHAGGVLGGKRDTQAADTASKSDSRGLSTDAIDGGGGSGDDESLPTSDPYKEVKLAPLTTQRTPSTFAIGGVRTPHMRMANRILESYEFKLEITHASFSAFELSALKELLETMEQTRTVWHMQLDHQRNRVLRVNLLISIASLGGLLCTLPAAFFGMNLDSGLEDIPGIFWPVIQGSVAVGILGAASMYSYYKFGPKRRYAARLRDMRSLRDLLYYHMDDMDAIIDAVKARGSLTRSEFDRVVLAAVKGRPMSPEEISLLFRVFDQNKDAVLELSELVRMEELQDQLQDQLSYHTS